MAWRRAMGAAAQEAWEATRQAAVFVSGVVLFHHHVGQVTLCVGPSMLPTLNPSGDVVLTEVPSVTLGRVRCGDVVVATSPSNPRHTVCKRVLGMQGDTVRWRSPLGRPVETVVPKGHVWLQGDNEGNSTDSRHYGPVPYAMLKGRVLCKVWPPSDAGALPGRPGGRGQRPER